MKPHQTDALWTYTASAPAEPSAGPQPDQAAVESGPPDRIELGPNAIEPGLIDLSAIEVIPDDPYALDLSVEQLERHEDIRVHGRPLGELTDAELAALDAEESTPVPPPDTAASLFDSRNLHVGWPQKPQPVRFQVDNRVVKWFSRNGDEPGPRINAVLRTYVEAQLKVEAQRQVGPCEKTTDRRLGRTMSS